MTGFVIGAAVAVVLALVLLMRPFLRPAAAQQTSQRELNAAIFREQLAKLEQDLADGTLAQEDYTQARAELQRRALEDTQQADEKSTLRAPRKTVTAVAVTLPLAAVALYLMIGNPASMLAGPAGMANPHAQGQDLERMVTALAQKLESEPNNQQGWAMLARSYKAMGRSMEAEIAYERAGSYLDDDAQALANYADVAATNAGGSLRGKPAQLIAKALKADPQNPMALWLSGTEALERKDYDRALATWERLMTLLVPGSEDARMLQGAIDEVRGRAGKPPKPAAGPAAAGAAVTPPAQASAASALGSISGTVELAATLKAQAAPGDTVTVVARLPGSRMPLALVRARAADLPLKFTLDDSQAMDPQSRLSAASEVEVQARVSRTGQAQPGPGDLLSAVQTVKVGTRGITLEVAQVSK
jgi:cytochrome c-type biogenesis protein CcmH